MKKKILLLYLLMCIVVIGGCKTETKTVDHNQSLEEVNIEEKGILESDKILIEDIEGDIRLALKEKWHRPITYFTTWENEECIVFLYEYLQDDIQKNELYRLDINNKKLNKLLEIEGDLWNGEYDPASDKFIYSIGLEDLYVVNTGGEPKKILSGVNWYNISPNHQRIVLSANGKQYIYYVSEDNLVETQLIPPMDYIFSNLVADWSPDSIHISSIPQGQGNLLNIIHAKENELDFSIDLNDSIISYPRWSPDGKYLAFLVQSPEYSEYIFEQPELYFLMSDTIGILNMETHETEYLNMEDQLIVKGLQWQSEGKGLFFESATIDECEKIIDNTIESKEIEVSVQYLEIDNDVKPVLDYSKIIENNEIYSSIFPLDVIDDDFLYCNYINGKEYLMRRNVQEEDITILYDEVGYIDAWHSVGNNILFSSCLGVYRIDESYNVDLIYDTSENTATPLISPNGSHLMLTHELESENYLDFISLQKHK